MEALIAFVPLRVALGTAQALICEPLAARLETLEPGLFCNSLDVPRIKLIGVDPRWGRNAVLVGPVPIIII